MSRAVPRFRRTNPNLPVPGTSTVIQINVGGLIEAQETVNTYYYVGAPPGPLTATDLTNAMTAWSAAFLPHYRAALSADWAVTTLEALCLTQPTLVTQVDNSHNGNAGTGPAGHEPTQIALCCPRYTAIKGQHGRGRIYLPAVPTSWVTASQITAAAGTLAYTNVAADLNTGLTISGIAYAAALVQRAKVSPRGIAGVAPLAQCTFRPLLATIRRRRIGRGK